MTIPQRFLLTCIAVCVALAVSVGEERPANDPCSEAVTTVEMRECLNQRYYKADGALNHVYQQLMSRLSHTRQTKLREAQRVWVRFRDKHAAFAASAAEGGTMAPLIALSVLASMTEKRVAELTDLFQTTDSQ